MRVSDLTDAVLSKMSTEDRAWAQSRAKARKPYKGGLSKQGTWSVSADLDPETGAAVLRLPYGMVSLNVWKSWHWSERDQWLSALTSATSLCRSAFILAHPGEAGMLPYLKARVQVVHHFPMERRRDPDNYAPKSLLDALRYSGWIQDDNAQVLDLPQPAFVVDGTVGTEVRILRLEG